MFKVSDKFNNLSPNKKRVTKNLFWAMTGKVVNMLSALFVGILVARYLGPAQYGLMNYVISYVSIFTVISSFGLDNIEIRELAKSNERRDVIIGTSLRIRFVCSLISLGFIAALLFIFKADYYTSIMILIYSVSIFTGCFNVIRNYFTSIIKNEYIVKTEVIRTIFGAAIKLILLWFKAPLEWFIIASTFDTLLVSSGYIISYKREVGTTKDWGYDKTLVPYYLKESFPLVLSGAAVIVYQRVDQVMIGNMIDNEAVGFFATAAKFVDLIIFLPAVLVQTITPLLVQVKQRSEEEYKIKQIQFTSLVVWLSILLSFIVSISSYWVITLTYGKEYLLSVPILQVLAWKTVGMAMSSSSGQIIIIDGIQKWSWIRNILGCALCVGLNLILIPRFGIIGSAWSSVIVMFCIAFVFNLLIPPYYNIWKMQAKTLLLGWKYAFKYLSKTNNINQSC